VGSVMLAYNRVNGRKMTEHAGLVNGFLRGELGFGGFTLTDYGLAQMSTAASANAGTDLEMPQAGWYSRPALQQAVATGQVSERTIDEAVSRILGQMFRFGIFDRDRPAPDSDASLPVERHARVARRVAERGLVLLKNEADLLPLDRERIGSIAVLGVKSDAYQRGGGSSSVEPAYAVTPLQGIRNLAGPGVEVAHDDSGSPQAASELAAAADIAVVIANDNMTEFADKPCLSLRCGDPGSGDQDGLIAAVADANPRTIVVLETGSPVTMPWANPVPAILAAWYPGQEGGNAIARVLFGRTDPGGRLPITFPASESDTPTADPARYPGIALEARYDEGVLVGYRHYDENGVEPLFPFGHGLSYARSRYSGLGLEPRRGGSVRVSFRVRNRGSRRGTDVPQVYVGIPEAPGVEQPPRWLRGFERIGLRPGKSKRVTIRLPRRAFSQWDADAGRWRVARGCHRIEVGASSRDLRLRGRIARGGGRC
jgi:beta-glucosidase